MKFIGMVDLSTEWQMYRSDIFSAIDSVARSGAWILGNSLKDFEISLANFFNINYSIGCASGLDAIEISLRALNLKSGDKVITTPLTAYATTLAIVKAGGVPVYVDVDNSGLLDLNLVAECLERDAQIRFLVPVHLFGHSLDLNRLLMIKNDYSLNVVEDCAQSIGAKSSGIVSGTVGQLSATSFYPTKNLGALGDGGAILTNDLSLMSTCRMIRDYGQSSKYKHDIVGMNSRLDDIQAAILNQVMLPKLNSSNLKRSKIAEIYKAGITNPYVSVLKQPVNSSSCWHLFPIQVEGSRDEFQKYMNDLSIGTSVHYPILCNQQNASQVFKYEIAKGGLQNAEKIAGSVVSIPINPYMSSGDVERVLNACNKWKPL